MMDVGHRLDELKARAGPGAARPTRRGVPGPRTLAEVIGGREAECAGQAYWRIETTFAEIVAKPAAWRGGVMVLSGGSATALRVSAEQAVVVDIETCGFAGTPVFLIGYVLLDRVPLSVVQLLARDLGEERAILRALAEGVAGREVWVTFNGKSFDEPFLRERATLHRVALHPPRENVDLLHWSRRAWRDGLPDCRLTTLEEHILKRPRVGDVPSSDVPDLYQHFMRTGNAGPLRPVLEHNQLDLVTATELLQRLARAES